MHRRLGRFEVQEAAVESAEGFHDSEPASSSIIQTNIARPCALATPARSASSVTIENYVTA